MAETEAAEYPVDELFARYLSLEPTELAAAADAAADRVDELEAAISAAQGRRARAGARRAAREADRQIDQANIANGAAAWAELAQRARFAQGGDQVGLTLKAIYTGDAGHFDRLRRHAQALSADDLQHLIDSFELVGGAGWFGAISLATFQPGTSAGLARFASAISEAFSIHVDVLRAERARRIAASDPGLETKASRNRERRRREWQEKLGEEFPDLLGILASVSRSPFNPLSDMVEEGGDPGPAQIDAGRYESMDMKELLRERAVLAALRGTLERVVESSPIGSPAWMDAKARLERQVAPEMLALDSEIPRARREKEEREERRDAADDERPTEGKDRKMADETSKQQAAEQDRAAAAPAKEEAQQEQQEQEQEREYVRVKIPKGWSHPYQKADREGNMRDWAIVNLPTGTTIGGTSLDGYSFDVPLPAWQKDLIERGEGVTYGLPADRDVRLFGPKGEDRPIFQVSPWELTKAVKAAREGWAASRQAERARAKSETARVNIPLPTEGAVPFVSQGKDGSQQKRAVFRMPEGATLAGQPLSGYSASLYINDAQAKAIEEGRYAMFSMRADRTLTLFGEGKPDMIVKTADLAKAVGAARAEAPSGAAKDAPRASSPAKDQAEAREQARAMGGRQADKAREQAR